METNLTPLEEIIHAELSALKALCQGSLRGPAFTQVRASLADYPWREPIHQALFRALLSIPFSDPKIIRDLLPARLTLLGFPDVKYEELFVPVSISPEIVKHLVEWLRQNS